MKTFNSHNVAPAPISVDDLQLAIGSHSTRDHGLCVMEAVAWVAGEQHSDMPKCVSPAISRYMQVLNDSGGDAVRKRLKSYIYKVIGTVDGSLELARAFIAADFAVRVFAPAALEARGHLAIAETLRRLEKITDLGTANAATDVTYTAYAAAYAAANAARAAAAAANAATDAADAAYATYAAAYAARAAAAAANAAYTAATNATSTVWNAAFRCLDAMLWPTPPRLTVKESM